MAGITGVADEQVRIAAGHDRAADEPADTGAPGDDRTAVGVMVPATSANLGPGFDSFGVALDVPLVAVVRPREDRRIVPGGQGAADLPTGDDNLVWQAVVAWCDFAGTAVPDISIGVESAIPLQRGMGSSSAAAIAGLLLGRALTGGTASDRELLGLATDIEGHPDNAAAALAGGLVACDGRGGYIRLTPSGSLRPVLLVPTQRQSTGEARAALPTHVTLQTAAATAARATATFAGLAGLVPLTAADMSDELHEPARLELMPTSRVLIEGLRDVGVPCALSGAGPSVLVVLPTGDDAALATVRERVSTLLADPDAVEVVPTAWHLSGASVCPPAQTFGPTS